MKVSGQLHSPAAPPAGKNLGTHCVGGWVGPQSRSWCFREQKHFFPCRNSNPGPSNQYRSSYTDWGTMEKYKTRKSIAGSVPRNVCSAISAVRTKLHLQLISLFGLQMATNVFDWNARRISTHWYSFWFPAQGNNLLLMSTRPFFHTITAPVAFYVIQNNSDIKCSPRYTNTTSSRYQKQRLQPSD